MATFRDLLASAKAEITEVTTEVAAQHAADGHIWLDVREPDEYAEGAIEGAIHIPRGHLEAQIEARIPDKSTPVVVYCAGGVRSAFAARTLGELGYSTVESMDGGFGRWKDEGRPWRQPASLSAEQQNRYKRHLLLPEVGVEGQKKLLDAKVLLLGAGGLGSPAALYPRLLESARSASSTWMTSTRRTCSVRSSTTSIASAIGKSTRRRRR